jgi:adenylate kinase family enzyme
MSKQPTRFLVYGVTGSGKSTLAARISASTGIPWHSVDDLTWEPDWVPVDDEEQRHRIATICAAPAWILDTAYGTWLDIPLARAEVIVALDYPRWLSLAWLTSRTARRLVDQRTICNGNRETLRQALGPDSIIRWHFRSFSRKRARIRDWTRDSPGPLVVRLTTPRQTNRWLQTLSADVA